MKHLFLILTLIAAGLPAAARTQANLDWVENGYKWVYVDEHSSPGLKAIAESGDSKAMYDYGLCLTRESAGKSKKYNEGLKWIYKAAEAGVPKAMSYIAGFSVNGIPEDVRVGYAERVYASDEADCIYRMASQWAYGIPYGTSREWTTDPAMFVKYVKRAAELGFKPAQHDLAMLYAWGGIPYERDGRWEIETYPIDTDYDESYRMFRLSGGSDDDYNLMAFRALFGNQFDEFRKLGDTQRAIGMFSVLYRNGYLGAGVSLVMTTYEEKQYKVAFETLKSLAEEHSDFIETNSVPGNLYRMLSSCYRFGRGCEPDEGLADFYLQKASAFPDNNDREAIREIINATSSD